ncbi:hypothetical protein A9Q81_20375 [Gammaproteobacteria bacterium 42_54_T18]|nr:hypothetical protein A9Q81_20375 [Gammaproteobacteria bacterium 42_54_T18]
MLDFNHLEKLIQKNHSQKNYGFRQCGGHFSLFNTASYNVDFHFLLIGLMIFNKKPFETWSQTRRNLIIQPLEETHELALSRARGV